MGVNSKALDDPLGMTLDPIGPKANPTRGEPFESGKVLFEDDRTEAGVWECTPGVFPARRDGFREVVTIIKGHGALHDADGNVTRFGPGSALALPEGWVGEWEIEETVRKVYVVSYSEPRA